MAKISTLLSVIGETSFGVLLSPDLIQMVLVFGAAQLLLFLYIAIAVTKKSFNGMKKFLSDLLRDKDGQFNIREVSTFAFLILILLTWACETFFSLPVPHYLVYLFFAGLGIGKVGYSIERKSGGKEQGHE